MLAKIMAKPIVRLSVVIFVNENILYSPAVLCNEIRHRNFARWTARKPSKVSLSGGLDSKEFYESEYTDTESNNQETVKSESKSNIDLTKKNKRSYEGLDYKVLGEHDSTFSKLMSYVGNRKMRNKYDLIMLEGKRLNLDAIQIGLKPKKIFFTQKSMLDELNLPADTDIPLYKIFYSTVKVWSKLDTPPGIIGFYAIPKENDIITKDSIPVKVLCDNIRDPGNMGSIIRVAAGAGCSEIMLMKGCTDPWDSKVLRAASGGHFHVPIKTELTWKEHVDFLQPSDLICLADSNLGRKDPFNYRLPRHIYYDVDYTSSRSVVVVVGGETEGLSCEAFKLAFHRDGSRITIPLSNCVDSLNSGCALSVVLFEIKRQLLLSSDKFFEVNKNKKENVL